MKTYKTTIEKPKLVIEHDSDIESPRQWDNLGYFITVEQNYNSPDDKPELRDEIDKLGGEVESVDEHMDKIKEYFDRFTEEKVLYITPVYRYEHGNVIYKRGHAGGFDISNCGFYIITDKTADYIGTPNNKKTFEKMIDSELKEYSQWVNGEFYRYMLFDDSGDIYDSCGGFTELEDIKEELGEEWKDEDMTEYINND